MESYIKIRGAREHNLKNVDVDIPKNKLIVFSGISGSGKSSMAFDTIYAEGQRRYVESLSTYARQFLGLMKKPDVDLIEGLSPSISIDQKTVSHNPRSTVGTVTEIYDYLRLLFARVGHPHCPICGREIASQTTQQIVEGIIKLIREELRNKKSARFLILSPVVKDRKGEFSNLFENIKNKGFRKLRIDGVIKDLDEDFVLIKTNKHTIEVVIDRIVVSKGDIKNDVYESNLKKRISDGVEMGLKLADGLVIAGRIDDVGFEIPENPKEIKDFLFSERFSCPIDNISLPEIEPRTFSFNSPHGACEECDGIGRVLKIEKELVFAGELSIKEGGIIPYASIFEHDTWLSRLILKVCEEHGIDPNKAVAELGENEIEILFNGTGEREYEVDGFDKEGGWAGVWKRKFEGIKGELERRHRETQSDYIRDGIERFMVEMVCEKCKGNRLKDEALGITIGGKSIVDITKMTIEESLSWVKDIDSGSTLSEREKEIAKLILKELEVRLRFLLDVGLNYLDLARAAYTLSGGEAQRIRLASQIGSGLTGVLYVLDEPTIGLHPKDNEKLVRTLKILRDLGNTVIVVEHDRDVINASDIIYDFGKGAGKHGGEIVFKGNVSDIIKDPKSLTGLYLSGKRKITFPKRNSGEKQETIRIRGARQFNLKNITVEFPLGKLVVVTGVSGSGKSTLVVETLYHAIAKKINKYHKYQPGAYDEIEGVDAVDKVVLIDQSPIGRTPRSNPATYTKIFDLIRDVYANTREARMMGYKKGRFSFNVKGGRCDACEGQGKNRIEMQFMPDIWVDCEVCKGERYNSQTLEIDYKGKNIADVLKMTVEEANEFFHVYGGIVRKLETLSSVGLDYMELGQSATTLSGGEAQRVKLATELSKVNTGRTAYILDEPTTGLHFADLERLLGVLKILVERGNSVIVVEHNMDIIKNADWLIDLGPEGGDDGGYVVAKGRVEDVIKNNESYTGRYIKKTLNG